MTGHRKRLVVLGSTGSIGTQTLDVVRAHPDIFEIAGLACRTNCGLLIQQINEFDVPAACILDTPPDNHDWPTGCQLLPHPEGMSALAADTNADIVVVATVGEAGFRPTEAALRAGNTVALASKELLVMAGRLFRDLADASGATILPIDSEHSALWQCMAGEDRSTIQRLVLTCSGGPFRKTPLKIIRKSTPSTALKHPNWDMGPKVTIDSASLLNKGLEVIEAHWLFGTPYDRLDVLIHPESIIHSMVEFHDGSLKAQLGTPDMRLPIQYALGYPDRLNGAHSKLDFSQLHALTFEAPDQRRFPLLQTALEAGLTGGTAPAILCGADEAAVDLFLSGVIDFGTMTDVVQVTMDEAHPQALEAIDQVLDAHREGIQLVRQQVAGLT